MKKNCLCALIIMSAGVTAFAQDTVAPVQLDRYKVAGLGLTAIPPDAFKDILESGELKMKVATLFEGKELRVEVFESTPAKTNHRKRPTDGDEFVEIQGTAERSPFSTTALSQLLDLGRAGIHELVDIQRKTLQL